MHRGLVQTDDSFQGLMHDYLDERVQQHDLKRALVFAASSCRTATEFRSVAERLTEVRRRQLASASLTDLCAWLKFVAWVATALWAFEPLQLNRLAHLPDDAESRCRVFLDILQLKPTISELSEASELQPIAMLSPSNDAGGLIDFISFPTELLDLIRQTYKRECSQCGKVPKMPCLCIACGALVCMTEDCGFTRAPNLREGGCEHHARRCGASQGLFMIPYMGEIVAIAGRMAGIWDCPYVDDYGQVDPELHRTVRLSLDTRRLDKLRTIWTTGTIGREILRQNQRTGRYLPQHL
jgi:hypothetical protein